MESVAVFGLESVWSVLFEPQVLTLSGFPGGPDSKESDYIAGVLGSAGRVP